jgi:hypothetical protein
MRRFSGDQGSSRKKTSEEEKWWRTVTRNALDAEYGRSCWIPQLTPEEIWEKSESWIYDRFERLGRTVQTGIRTEELLESVSHCLYTPHRERKGSEYLPELWLRPGTREYVHLVKRLGLCEVRAWQQAFLRGFDDVYGNHWCGLCHFRQRFMDAGRTMNYPDVSMLFVEPETRGVEGYRGWLRLACTGRPVFIETLAMMAESRHLSGKEFTWNRCTNETVERALECSREG